jgi:4-alpha-glucanotransferase
MLCHLSSIPVGTTARFVDFLADAGLSIWQVLPLHPPDSHRSPYNSRSLFALDPRLVEQIEIEAPDGALDYESFRMANAHWLEPFALFECAREQFGPSWRNWPLDVRRRRTHALARLRGRGDQLETVYHSQFKAFRALINLRAYANARGVLLFGDMPLYPAVDSADAWSHPELLSFNADFELYEQAGVPPDYFSESGQLWGNPVWNWQRLQDSEFNWWRRRAAHLLSLFDVVRLDHFRGLSAFWVVPGNAKDAQTGVWREAPGDALLSALHSDFGSLPLVAEDLGIIDAPVLELRDQFGLPGMRVLQFAFNGDPDNPHLPANFSENSVAYTGTHDNDTSLGWYLSLDAASRQLVDEELADGPTPSWRLIETAFQSRANSAIVPLQDFLDLDGQHRMNTPGTREGNWSWGFDWASVPGDLAARIRNLNERCGRL